MNVFLWILQIVLGVMFLMAGGMKVMQPKQQLAENMGWVEEFEAEHVKGIGVLEILAGLALILPGIFDVATILTPLAAAGLAVLMIGAMITHSRRNETQMIIVNAMLFVGAVIVAWGRFGPEPLG